MARTRSMKAVALVVALASLTINFGLIDLIDGYTGFVDQARNQVLDAGWGLVFGVVLPVGLLAQLRRPERRIAGIQQTGVVALALAVAPSSARRGGIWRWRRESQARAASWWRCIRPEGRSSGVGGAWSRGCWFSRPSRLFRASCTPDGWPRPSGAIFRLRMPFRTASTTGP